MQDRLSPVIVLHARWNMMGESSDVSIWKHRGNRPTPTHINLRRHKQVWLDYCKARPISPSEAFRQIRPFGFLFASLERKT
jgi:hypothetical protein